MILRPVNDESDRGRNPVLRDELAVVASLSAYPRERILIILVRLPRLV
jgi:hypothetical protein